MGSAFYCAEELKRAFRVARLIYGEDSWFCRFYRFVSYVIFLLIFVWLWSLYLLEVMRVFNWRVKWFTAWKWWCHFYIFRRLLERFSSKTVGHDVTHRSAKTFCTILFTERNDLSISYCTNPRPVAILLKIKPINQNAHIKCMECSIWNALSRIAVSHLLPKTTRAIFSKQQHIQHTRNFEEPNDWTPCRRVVC